MHKTLALVVSWVCLHALAGCESAASQPARSTAALGSGAVDLDALDCLPIGLVSPSANPSLPFYQPLVDGTTIDDVVQTMPGTNRFNVYDQWVAEVSPSPTMCNPSPLVTPWMTGPVLNWVIGEYTGWWPGTSYADFQRGQIDAYAQSAVQVLGSGVGLWLNSMDVSATANFEAQNGTNALSMGCWFGHGPLAAVLPSGESQLDVSFDAEVNYDGSVGDGGVLAYFDMILFDCSGDPACASGIGHSGLNIQVGFYGDVGVDNVHSDKAGTGATPLYIASTNLGQSSAWFTNLGASWQAGPCVAGICNNTQPAVACSRNVECPRPVFGRQHFHFRMSRDQLANIVSAVRIQAQKDDKDDKDDRPPPSLDLASYGIGTLNVIGEAYDPCKDLCGQRICHRDAKGNPIDHAQLGMNVSNLRVTTTIPHRAASVPFGFNSAGSPIVYRDGQSSQIFEFDDGTGTAPFARSLVDNHRATGAPMGFVAGYAKRVVFRGDDNHVYQAVNWDGKWQPILDMNSVPGVPLADGDPYAFNDSGGGAHIVYRGTDDHLHDIWLDMAHMSWHHTDISGSSGVPVTDDPMGYLHASTLRVVYRSNNDIYEAFASDPAGPWVQWNMTEYVAGAVATASRPKGALDPSGRPHVVYRDRLGDVHDLLMDASGWRDIDITSRTGATPALGSPMPFVGDSALHIVYYGKGNDPNLGGHVYELKCEEEKWAPPKDLSAAARGALPLSTDPMAFVDANGVSRIEYKGNDGQLHELLYSGNKWLHRDL
jgi:hypothetical protein